MGENGWAWGLAGQVKRSGKVEDLPVKYSAGSHAVRKLFDLLGHVTIPLAVLSPALGVTVWLWFFFNPLFLIFSIIGLEAFLMGKGWSGGPRERRRPSS